MGLYKENPRYKCVSARLSDEEWEDLMIVCGQKRTSMSECIREALTALLMENGLGGGLHRRADGLASETSA